MYVSMNQRFCTAHISVNSTSPDPGPTLQSHRQLLASRIHGVTPSFAIAPSPDCTHKPQSTRPSPVLLGGFTQARLPNVVYLVVFPLKPVPCLLRVCADHGNGTYPYLHAD